MISLEYLNLTDLHGVPTQIVYGSRFFVTTLLAPIQHPSPIVTPDKIIISSPIQTSFPIVILPFECKVLVLLAGCSQLKYSL